MSIIRRFTDTLGFLTRLAPARVIPEEEMNRYMAYMAPVGAVLGVVVVLPFYLGLFGSTPWIQAWLMVAANIYLRAACISMGWPTFVTASPRMPCRNGSGRSSRTAILVPSVPSVLS